MLRELLQAGAARAGLTIDVGRVLSGLEGAAAAFTRRRGAPDPPPIYARRRRLRRVLAAACDLEDALKGLAGAEAGLERSDRDALRLEASVGGLAGLYAVLGHLREEAERRLLERERQARPGPRQDRATRRLVLDVAQVLHRDGLPLTTQPDGLLARVASAVAVEAGHALPADERGLRRLLRPAVRFHRGEGAIPHPRDVKDTLPRTPTGPVPCPPRKREGKWAS